MITRAVEPSVERSNHYQLERHQDCSLDAIEDNYVVVDYDRVLQQSQHVQAAVVSPDAQSDWTTNVWSPVHEFRYLPSCSSMSR